MELDALKFTVETTALDDAITKVGTLQLAVKKLGSDTGSQSARQAAKEQAQITLDQVKAETALIEARGKQARAIEKSNEAQEKQNNSTKNSTSILEKYESILKLVADGSTRGNAGILQMAQAAGVSDTEFKTLKTTLEGIKTIIGGDPFDKSNSALKALTDRNKLATVSMREFATDTTMTMKQVQGLTLDLERQRKSHELNKLAIEESSKQRKILISDYIREAELENTLTASAKAHAEAISVLNKARQDEESWIKRTNKELENSEAKRINSIAKDFEDAELVKQKAILRTKAIQESVERKYELTNSLGFSKSEASAIYNFEQQIKKTGETLDVSKAKVEAFMVSIREPVKATADPFAKEQALRAKAVEKSANDQVKALAKADEMLARLQNRTKEMSKESPVSATAANQLYAYEKALKAAGVGADDATARLAVFRAEQQKVSQLSRAEETLRMQHLSRALAPQVTDVTVGLMTGQNPFTVFLQQGGQIRDQIGLSQVAVENLGKVFKDTFVMMGAMVAGMGRALYAFFLTPVGAAVLALSAFAIGMYEAFQVMVDGEEKTLALNKALIMFGNSAGLTVNSLKALSKEAATVDGISVGKSTEAMAALAKASGLTSDEFVKAAQSAVLLERYAGVSLDKTADAFKALSKEPLKAVEKLNEETGFFSDTIIAQVAELERLGKKEEAGALAKEAYSAATIKAANDIKDSLTGFGKFLDTAGNEWNRFWERVTGKNVKVDFGSKIKEIDDKIAEINASRTVLQAGGMNITIPSPMADREVQGLLATRGDLVYKRASENAKAEAQQRQTDLGQNQMDIEKLTNKHMITVDTKTTEINKAIELYNKSINNALSNPETFKNVSSFIEKRDKLIHDIQTGKKGDPKAKEEKSDSLSFSLANDTAQARKQYDIQLKDQTDFVNQQKQRLDNSLAAKEISQGEYIAREIALVMKGEAEQSKIIEDSMVKEQENYAKDRASLTQQYKDWQAKNKGVPEFVDLNKQKAEELQSKLGDLTNTFNSATEKLMASSDKVKETAFTRMIKQISELKGAIREVILEREKFQRSEDELLSKQKRQTAIEDKLRYASPEQAAFIQAQAQEQERLNAIIKVYNEELAKADINLKGYNAALASETDPEIIKFQKEQIVLLEAANEERRKSRDLELGRIDEKALVQAQNAQLKYQKDQMKALSDSVAGALEEGLYKGGAEGAKSLRNIIEAELRKPVTIFIKAVVGDLTQQLTGGISGSKQESSLWLKDFGLATTNSIYELGGALTSSGFESLGNSVTGLAGSVSKYSSEITAAGNALSYFNAASLLAEGKYGSAAGSAIGTYFGGPIGGKVGQQIGSLLDGGKFTSASSTGYSNKSFSNTGTASDISTTTSGAGNIVDALYAGYAKKAESLGISKAAARFSFSSNTGREGQNPNFTLQASAGGRDYITQTDNPGLFGSNEIAMSDANMQLQANRAILTALQGSEMPKYLKGAFDSLVVGSMDAAAVNATFEAADALKLFHDQLQLLPFEPLKDLSYTATEALKAFSGGLDKFGANLGTYYDKFYTAQEKADLLTKNTKKAFEDLGLVLPDINDQLRTNYRAIVEELSAKDLSIAKNAAAYAGVLQLASSVDQLVPVLDKTSTAIVDTVKLLQDAANEAIATNNKLAQDRLQKVSDAATAAMSALSKSIQAQKDTNNALLTSQSDVIQSSLDGVSSSISKLKDLSNSLKSTLDSMRITGSEGDYRVQAQSQISQALQTARTGGGLPLDGQLTSALATVSKPSENLFGSFEDYARDFYRTANDISDLNDLTTKQLTADEVTQGILNKQLKEIKSGFDTENKALDDILKNAQLQLDAANGLDVTIKTVTESLKSFGDAILKLTAERATQDLATSRGVTYTKEDILAAVKASLEAGGSVADIYKAAALKFGVGASTITQATTGSGLVGFNQTPTKYSPEEILSAVKASLSQGATVADIYKAAYDKFGVTTAQVNAAVQGQGLSGFTTGAATGTQFSQDQMAAWLSQASAAGWSVAEMYNRALSDYGVSNSTLAQVGHAVGIPGFAVGTNYVPYDMTANIHKGERIIPAADNLMLMNTLSRVSYNQQGSNDSELKEELKDMKLLLKTALDKIADNTKQSADLLDAVTAGGNAMLTEAA